MAYQITVNIAEGKYTYVMNAGGSHVYRHMEPWRDCTGDKLLLCMAQDIESSREQRDKLREALTVALATLEDEFGMDSCPASHARAALEQAEDS